MSRLLLLTRPLPESQEFAQQLRGEWPDAPNIHIAPLINIVALPPPSLPDADGVIFSSARAVSMSQKLGFSKGFPAYCIGQRSRELAQLAGFEAHYLGPDIKSACVSAPDYSSQHLLYLCGEPSSPQMPILLEKMGAHITRLPLYAQRAGFFPSASIEIMAQYQHVIAPVFSQFAAQTLHQALMKAAFPYERLVLCAISARAAAPFATAPLHKCLIAEYPDAASLRCLLTKF